MLLLRVLCVFVAEIAEICLLSNSELYTAAKHSGLQVPLEFLWIGFQMLGSTSLQSCVCVSMMCYDSISVFFTSV